MPYIIAFVKLEESVQDYAVGCFRTDLKVDDLVLVSLENGKKKPGMITGIDYLNWDCKGRIVCKLSELVSNEQGALVPRAGVLNQGLATMGSTIEQLVAQGWTVQRTVSTAYKAALTVSNDTVSAYAFFRKNGVDLQVLPYKHASPPVPFAMVHLNRTVGRFIAHYLSGSDFNLYEGVDRFSRSFIANEGDYDRFFTKSIGSAKLISPADLKRTPSIKDLEDLMSLDYALRDTKDGSGNIYLGDGIYL